VIAEPNPTLVAFDQNAWAQNLDYARRLPKIHSTPSGVCGPKLRSTQSPARIGLRARRNAHGRGPLTRQLLDTHAEHAESHARQVQTPRRVQKRGTK
jgi:hypothetical protein